MIIDRPRPTRATFAACAFLLAGMLPQADAIAASIAEPSTVFYGRIIGTGSDQPFLVTSGELEWRIERPDGSFLVLRKELWPLRDGEFSYRLDVPHEALALGLQASPASVALKSVEERHSISGITVDGVPAVVAGPEGPVFDAAQARRAATYRLDLEVPLDAPDSDGDGLPDWWEKQFMTDAHPDADPDGDGLSNLEEYRLGSNPLEDSRRPRLVTEEIHVFSEVASVVLLRTLDSDSAPDQLRYTLLRAPESGFLRLRNALPSASDPDLTLGAGATFTQEDVNSGRVVFIAGETASATFEVSVRDQDEAGEPDAGTVRVVVYQPPASPAAADSGSAPAGIPAADLRRWHHYVLARNVDAIAWDGSAEDGGVTLSIPTTGLSPGQYSDEYLPRFGEERRHVLMGGKGGDTLRGGARDDFLSGGAGDDQLAGGPGADRFLYEASDSGADTVEDFTPEEGDVLDLTRLLRGASTRLRDYIRLRSGADGPRLEIDRDGDGSGFTDVTILLRGLAVTKADLHELLESGSLEVGELALPPRISIAARTDGAENGPTPGEFVLERTGPLTGEVRVHFELKGAAAAGIDYASVPSSVTFAPGERTATIRITPFADSTVEPDESVELTLLPGDDYELGAQDRGQISIADLRPVVTAEALEPFATLSPPAAGMIAVSRTEVLDRNLLVRLEIGGTGAEDTAEKLPRFVNFAPGESTTVIRVTPAADLDLGDQARSVHVRVLPDPAYLPGSVTRAEVLIVRETITFDEWRQRHFPGVVETPAVFGASDPGASGVPVAWRYAFGMDPTAPEKARMPKYSVRNGHLTLDVWRRPGATDVELVVEASPDPSRWTPRSDWVERIHPPGLAGQPDVVSFRAVPSLRDAPQLFLNIRVVIRP